MGDNIDQLFLNRLTIIEKGCGEAKSVKDLEDYNSMLMDLRKRIEKCVSEKTGINQYSTSSLNKLRKDSVVFYCSVMMKLCELSTCNAQRLIQEKMEKEEIKDIMVENMGLKSELLMDKRAIIDLQKHLVSKSEVTVKGLRLRKLF